MNSTNSIDNDNDQMIIESALQKRLLRFTMSIIHSFQLSNFAYIIIMIIEFIQIIAIIINGNFYNQWQGAAFTYVRKILGFITLEKVIELKENVLTGILIAAVSLLVLIIIIFALISCYGSELDNISQVERIMGNSMGFILILFKSLLQIPCMFMIIYSFTTESLNKNLNMSLSGILIALLMPILLYQIFIFSNLNPFSTLVFAGETYWKKISTLLYKVYLVLFSALDKNKKNQLTMLIIFICIMVLLTIINRWIPQSEFKRGIKKFGQWQRYTLIWFVFFIIICNYTSTQAGLWIYFIMVSLVLYAFMEYIDTRKSQKILYEDFAKIEKKELIETHIVELLYLIDSAHKRQSRILLQGYISFHIRNCSLPSSICQCKEIFDLKKIQLEDLKRSYFEFVANLLKSALNRVDQIRRIYLLLAYIYQYRLNNKFQAVHCLIRSASSKNSLIERLEYLQQMKLIQSQIIEYQSKKNTNLAVDMVRFLKFNLKIVEFEQLLETCSNNHVDFWNELLETNLNIQKLESCGAIIANQKEVVKDYFHEMQELNSNNAHIMILYGQFLAWVCNEDFQNLKLLQKGETILKNIKQSSKINGKNEKYSENSRTSIIIISGNEKQLGKILQTNNYVFDAIGYHRRELISNNISSIMPKIFAENHDAVLRRFLTTSKDRSNGVERLVPVLCKDGFIAPMLALTKPLPNLEEGVQIVGFLSDYEPSHDDQLSSQDKIAYILYDIENEIVMGISKTCYTEYGIPKCLVYGDPQNSMNELKIKHIFGLNLQKSQGGVQTGRQIMASINGKGLKDEFIITHPVSTNKIIELSSDNCIDCTTQVIVRSILEITYHGTSLRIISITKDTLQKSEHNKLDLKSGKDQQSKLQKQEKSETKSETDELKDLKDFKNFISVKREPAAIRFINWACIMLILVYTVGVAGYIVVHIRQFAKISATMEGIQLAFLNRMYMTQLSFESQKIFINYNQAYPPGQIFPQLESSNKMNYIIQQAKQGQLYILPIKYQLGVKDILINNFDFFPNGSYRVYPKSIDQSITIQLSKISNIPGNGKYLRAYPLDFKSLTVLNYMEQKYTELFSFIDACSQVQESIASEGVNNNKTFQTYIIIQSSILAVLALIWLLVSMPRTLQVTDINSKVLSLFSLISAEDVHQVIKRCYVFQSKYLVEANVVEKANINYIKEFENEAPLHKRKNKPQNSRLNESNHLLPFFSPSPSPSHSPLNSLNASFADTSSRNIVVGEMKNKETFNTAQSLDMDASDKMINNVNEDKKKAFLTFFIIFLFLVGYSGTITGYLITNYNSIWTQTITMNIIYNRTAQFQQIKTTYIFYLSQNNLSFGNVSINKINLDLIAKMYDTEVTLVNQEQSSIYSSIINALNTDNLCNEIERYQNYKIWGESQLNASECNNVEDGILTRGIKTSLVDIMEEIRGMALLTQAQRAQLNMLNQTVETIKKYTILQKYIVRPLIMVSQKIIQAKKNNERKINFTFYLINTFFLVAIAIFWRVAWTHYLEYLNESVWRTKSMLNIIPTKIITSNEVLMNEFTSGQLEKIVK